MGLSSKPQKCLWCKEMYHKDARNLYCSRKCSNEARTEKVTVACAFCGKEKTRSPSVVNMSVRHFCNMNCKHNQTLYERSGYIMNEDLREQIANLIIEGWTRPMIVDMYGVSKATIGRIKKEYLG